MNRKLNLIPAGSASIHSIWSERLLSILRSAFS